MDIFEVPELGMLILQMLDVKEIFQFCQLTKQLQTYWQSDSFWQQLLERDIDRFVRENPALQRLLNLDLSANEMYRQMYIVKDRCDCVFTRGMNKGQYCPQPNIKGYVFCENCIQKKMSLLSNARHKFSYPPQIPAVNQLYTIPYPGYPDLFIVNSQPHYVLRLVNDVCDSSIVLLHGVLLLTIDFDCPPAFLARPSTEVRKATQTEKNRASSFGLRRLMGEYADLVIEPDIFCSSDSSSDSSDSDSDCCKSRSRRLRSKRSINSYGEPCRYSSSDSSDSDCHRSKRRRNKHSTNSYGQPCRYSSSDSD